MKALILLGTLFFAGLYISYAQVGKVDTTFGNKGAVTADIGTAAAHAGYGSQVLLNPDGSMYILISTNGKTIVEKKHADGSPDPTYGHNGFSVIVDIFDAHAALQPDGKLVIAGRHINYGYYAFALARLSQNGNLDNTFGNGIVVTGIGNHYDAINSIDIDKNGSIVVAGFSAADNEFDADGNGIPVSGTVGSISFVRFNSDGSLTYTDDDAGIHASGLQSIDARYNLVNIQNNGKIIIAGTGNAGLNMARFNSNGSPDNTFEINNHLQRNDGTYFFVRSLAVQNDGKILVGGFWQNNNRDFVVARYKADGTLDSTFASHGIQATDFRTYDDVLASVKVQNDGKIVAAGFASNGINYGLAVARYNSNGRIDSTFDSDGKKITYIGPGDIYGNSEGITPDGKIIVVGYTIANNTGTVKMAKYKVDGAPDSSFAGKGILTDSLKQRKTGFTSIAFQEGGKVITAGYSWNGANYDFAVARYLTDGRPDKTFSSDGIQTTDLGADEFARAVAVQPDGKIIAAGKAIIRYTTNGSLDNTFNGTGKQTPGFEIFFVKLQPDGKIIAAGGQQVSRYNSNGSPDVSFNGTGKLSTTIGIKDIVLQKDGKIVVIDGAFNIARYNADGTFDGSSATGKFEKIDFFKGYVDDGTYDNLYQYSTSLAIQNDGKIVIGGYAGGDARNGYFVNTAVARYNLAGKLDSTFSGTGMEQIYFERYTLNPSIAIQDDDKIVIKSTSYYNGNIPDGTKVVLNGYAFARLTGNGDLDLDFGSGGKEYANFEDTLSAIVIGDNKLYVAGTGKKLDDYGFLTRYLLAPNKYPVVNITSPANNALYAAPATITLKATASAPDDAISYVQFYNNGTLLATDSTSPYSYSIANAAAGNYSFVAKAVAGNTLTGNSASVAAVVAAPVNKAPFVNISSPANNAVYAPNSGITLHATASDSDGTITSVKFYNGTILLKTDSTAPYDYTMNNAITGSYKFYAKAFDNKGLTGSSATVSVFVGSGQPNKTPSIVLSTPAGNASYSAPASIVLNASASGGNGIQYVQFYNGTTLLATDSTYPFSYTLSDATAGNYSFSAKAVDSNSLSNTSASVAVYVQSLPNKAPVVNITSPLNNAVYYASATINITATASDGDGSVRNVKFYNGATLLATDTSAPYSFTVNSLAAGNYSFTVKATDDKGLAGSSATSHITVLKNIPPEVYVYPTYDYLTFPPAVYLTAGASDPDGTISYVDFYNGTTLLNRDSTYPYEFAWLNVPPGDYSLIARATDNHGAATTSSPVSVPLHPYTSLEAEDAYLNSAVVASGFPGFTDRGYVQFTHNSGDFIEWDVKASIGGPFKLQFRYANGSTNRPLRLTVNGVMVNARLDFSPTGSWSTWSVSSATVNLSTGHNKVRLTSIGSGGPNVDNLSLIFNPQSPEAEDAVLRGPLIASEMPGFTGSGYADYINASGDYIEWTTHVPGAGAYTLKFRYANGSTNRPLQLQVNGVIIKASLDFASSGGWGTWSISSANADLIAGANTIRLTTIGLNGPNVDNLSVVANPSTLEAEEAVLYGAVIASGQPGFTGSGYADYTNASGDYIEWTANAADAGSYSLKFRYANGSSNRPLQLQVNGVVINNSVNFPSTGGWTNWAISSASAKLTAGANKIRLTTMGANGPNIDNLSLGSFGRAPSPQSFVPDRIPLTSSANGLKAVISPNPATANARLILSEASDLPVKIELTDMLGKIYPSVRVIKRAGKTFDLSLNSVPAGTYIITVKQGNLSTHARLILAK